jgi:hypothetical protein
LDDQLRFLDHKESPWKQRKVYAKALLIVGWSLNKPKILAWFDDGTLPPQKFGLLLKSMLKVWCKIPYLLTNRGAAKSTHRRLSLMKSSN